MYAMVKTDTVNVVVIEMINAVSDGERFMRRCLQQVRGIRITADRAPAQPILRPSVLSSRPTSSRPRRAGREQRAGRKREFV
jgi:hypothetical protein